MFILVLRAGQFRVKKIATPHPGIPCNTSRNESGSNERRGKRGRIESEEEAGERGEGEDEDEEQW